MATIRGENGSRLTVFRHADEFFQSLGCIFGAVTMRMFAVDVLDAGLVKQLVRGPREIDVRESGAGRESWRSRCDGVCGPMTDHQRRSGHARPIGRAPAAGGNETAGKTVRQTLTQMIGAHAAHGLTTEEDAIDIDVKAVAAFADYIHDVLFGIDRAPAGTGLGNQRRRGNGDHGNVFDVGT